MPDDDVPDWRLEVPGGFLYREHYWDRSGTPITYQQWAALRFNRPENSYFIVGRTELADGDVHVSTVWIGMDLGYGDGPPLIFETMIFGGPYDLDCWRWPTEQDALAGHGMVVELAKLPVDARYEED